MKSFVSYLRVLVVMTVVYLVLEFSIDSGDQFVFIAYPEINLFFLLFFILLIAFEVIIGTLQSIADMMMTPEKLRLIEEKKSLARQNNIWIKTYRFLVGEQKKQESELLIEDHDYDGIRELDNSLPPWWLYLFYATVVFGCVYLVRYHILGHPSQELEFEQEMAQAELEVAAYKETAKDLVDASSVFVLDQQSDLDKGKAIFTTHCVVCHMNDGGGGIGPNLTDKYWILGGDISSIFTTIFEGGRPAKGMVSWKSTLRPLEIQQVASYILTLQNTIPSNPKAPEGDLFAP